MSWGSEKLGVISPAKPLKKPVIVDESNIWQLNLDMVESQTGNVLKKLKGSLTSAGSSTHWFSDKHVLYSKLRPYLNKVVLPDEQGLATTELVPLLPDAKRVDRSYLVHYLRSNKFVGWVNQQVAGAKMPRVSMKDFWDHEIPLPYVDEPEKSLIEQKRIAAILDKADSIRRKRQDAIELADKFLRDTFLTLFGDPVTNPKGWEVKALKAITTKIGSGSTPRGGKSAYQEEGISLVRSLNIHDDKFLFKNLAFINDDQANKLSNAVLEQNDVLLNITGASVCRTAIVDNSVLPARVNQHVCIIRSNDVCSQYLLHLLISGPYKRLLLKIAGAGGATREALTKEQVEKLMIPIPPADLQQKFAQIKSSIQKIKEKYTEQVSEPLFESLSQKAFKGEL